MQRARHNYEILRAASVECLAIEPAIDVLDFEPDLSEELLDLRRGRVSQRHAFDHAIRATVATHHLERDFEVEYMPPFVPGNGSGESRDSPTVPERDLTVVQSPVRWAELVEACRPATWQVQGQPCTSREVTENRAEAFHLIVVREEMHESAEWDDREGERPIKVEPPHVGLDELNMPPNALGFADQLGAAAVEHGRRNVDPDDIEASSGNREKDLAGATSQFKYRPTGPAGEVNVEVDVGTLANDLEVVVGHDRQRVVPLVR
ncbi:MAG: hypothetical protein OXG79_11395 [Chloroflexi bacterium]|nr:hypothetical protein [Chloroflexota bacterium]